MTMLFAEVQASRTSKEKSSSDHSTRHASGLVSKSFGSFFSFIITSIYNVRVSEFEQKWVCMYGCGGKRIVQLNFACPNGTGVLLAWGLDQPTLEWEEG